MRRDLDDLRRSVEDGTYLLEVTPGDIAEAMMSGEHRLHSQPRLFDRHSEVVALAYEGTSREEIARRLGFNRQVVNRIIAGHDRPAIVRRR